MKKRIFALAMALAMAATAAGCGAKQSTDVEALLQKANDTMAQVTSMSAQMEVQMDMAYEEESMKSVVKSDMDLIMDPFKTNMTISIYAGGRRMDPSAYGKHRCFSVRRKTEHGSVSEKH